MATPKPWVDGPYKLIETPSHRLGCNPPDPKLSTADSMCQAHNAFIRAINAVMLQARGVSNTKDAADFCIFGGALVESLHLHHSTEEEMFFPPLEKALGKPGIMDGNVEEHHVFHNALEEFQVYCKVTSQRPEEYSADKILELCKKMSDDLVPHLHDEIDSLVDVGKTYDPDGSIQKKCWDEWEVQVIKIAKRDLEYPFVLGCIDHTFEDGMWISWPPVPWFVPYLVMYWHARKYSGAWRFLPCYWMKPRELAFLPEAEA